MDIDENRFRFHSYASELKDVHLPSALDQSQRDHDFEDSECQFHDALQHWRQLNLSPSFITYANKSQSLSASLPLLLHNWKQVVQLWVETVVNADDESLKALLDILQKLLIDLRGTVSPAYPDILNALLRLLTCSISTASLTTLLSTFTLLFKHLLVPSTEPELLVSSWSAVHAILKKCQPEIQRAMAEVWGTLLRRLKVVSREKAVLLVAADLAGIEDAIAWIFVSASKSVSQTLHTAVPTIITPLVEYYITCSEQVQESTYTLVRRVLTALIHHVKNSAGFAPIGDFICQKALAMSKETDPVAQRRMLEVVAVPCSVRHGSRLTDKHLTALLPALHSVTITEDNFSVILKLSSAIIVSPTGEMALWMGVGRRYLEHIWSLASDDLHTKFILDLHGILVEMGWGGCKMVALPTFMKRCVALLDKDAIGVLRLLTKMNDEGKLGDVDVVWKRGLETWVLKRLNSWDDESSNSLMGLDCALKLSSCLSGDVTVRITEIIDQLLVSSSGDKRQNDFLRLFLTYIVKRSHSEWSGCVDILTWTANILSGWSNSPDILAALVQLKKTSKESTQSFHEIYGHLAGCLLSHDPRLRLSALRILASCPDAPVVVGACLAGEEVSLDIQGVRERVLKTSRVTQAGISTDIAADVSTRWLLSQLKVNLKPVWKTAAMTITEVVQSGWGEKVWSILWKELQVTKLQRSSEPNSSDTGVEDDEDWESERTWRDPSAHKLTTVIQRWQNGPVQYAETAKSKGINSRFDGRSYVLELLNLLGQCHLLAEKHNRELVPFFLSLVPSLHQQRQHLVAYLNLFAQFSNPKALYATNHLHSLYLDLLAHPDRYLQTAALSCVLTYKNPSFVQWQDRLKVLLDDTRWRDELTSLDLTSADTDVTEVVIRMLFGIMLERKGKSRRGNERRTTILGILGGCSSYDLGILVRLMLKPLSGGGVEEQQPPETDKQRTGFFTLLDDVLKNLGPKLVQYWPELLDKTVQLTSNAQSCLSSIVETEEVEYNGDEKVSNQEHGTKSTRVVRQLGIKRFADFFRIPVTFDFAPYAKPAFDGFISPRIPSLDVENIQSPSALLDLFAIWTNSTVHALYLVEFDVRLLPKIFDCLVATNVKPAVIAKIFDIVERLLSLATTETTVRDVVVKPYIGHLLKNMSIMAERMKGTEDALVQRQIHVLSEIAHHSSSSEEAKTLFKLFSPLLRKSHKVVSEKVKADLLKIISHLIPLIPELEDATSDDYVRLHATVSHLFQRLRLRNARLSLVDTLRSLASVNTSLDGLADLLVDLNAYSQKRVDEPDFDRRLKGFISLTDVHAASLSFSNWSLVIHQTLYSIHDPEELAIRTSSASVLRLFIDLLVSTHSAVAEHVFTRTLFVGLKNGLQSKNELVRSEILGVLAYSVQKCDSISAVQDMRALLGDGDEEVNFFNNIHHVQVHRRSRALRRLADQCDEHPLKSSTLAEIILPLVSNYIVTTTSSNHHLVTDAINTTGRLAKHLAWGAYYALVGKYMRLVKAKDDTERIYVRVLVALLDNFHFPMDAEIPAPDSQEEDTDGDVPMVAPAVDARVSDAVNNRLLPELLKFLESRDSTTEDTTRIPIAVGIIKVALHLPAAARDPQITRLLTVTSQILRSKSQETRDLTRDTLVQISSTLGPSYLQVIIRELRGALLRGPHLHVLAYTTHSLLTHVTSPDHAETFHTLDDCTSDVAHIAAEVVFGESGKDVQSEDFKTKMREVRGSASKGFDSFAIMARHISPSYISGLLAPLRSIMHQTATSKVLGLVDEAVKRIVSGLNLNKHLDAEQLLSICHTLINQNSQFLTEAPSRYKGKGKKNDAIVQIKHEMKVHSNHYSNNAYRFIVLGLDLFQTALRRSRFDFRNTGIISRLESMLVTIGNSLYSNNTVVLIMGLKCTSGMMKCPLRTWGKALPVIVRQTLDIIKSAGSTESDLAQTALKSLAVVLRDGPPVDIKEKDLVFLLELIAPDLEESARQSTVFTMLRSIVSRKFVVPEIYDLMERVSEVMVTSQSAQVRELCRGLLLQFLLDYPQGKGRLRTQMTFLAKNLAYVHESGRKSVMELLGAILTKFQGNLVQEYADLLFVALVMVIANDDSSKCVELASHLIKSLFIRLDEERRAKIVSHLHSWASQHDRPRLAQISAQLYSILIDALGDGVLEHIPLILQDVNQALETSAKELEKAEMGEDSMEVDLDWQSPLHSLVVVSKILQASPERMTQVETTNWTHVTALLLFPHPLVQTASSHLIGSLYSTIPVAPPLDDASLYPLSRTGMMDIARKSALQLKSPQLDEALSLQIVKNLLYLGKCFKEIPLDTVITHENLSDDSEEEDGTKVSQDPLPWLFSKLSYQVRSAHIARRNRHREAKWDQQPLAILRWFAAMATYLDATNVERFLVHILSPLYRIIEDDTIRDASMEELKAISTELQDLVQSKVGATAFSVVYNQIRQGVLGVRRERKTLRALQVATNPAAAAKRKYQKNGMKKESRKRKNESFADGRGKLKRPRA